MTKKQSIILIFTLVIIAAVAVVVWGGEESKPINSLVTDNGSEVVQSDGSESKEDNGQKYEIDLSSDVDTSGWPTFTSKALGFSIKYHPDGRWESNDPNISDPTEAVSPSFRFINDPYAGSLYFGNFYPLDEETILEDWYSESTFTLAVKKGIKIANSAAIIELRGSSKRESSYVMYIYSNEREGIYKINFSSEYHRDSSRGIRKDGPAIFKAMLQTITFHPKVDLDVSRWEDHKIEALGVRFKLPRYFGKKGSMFDYTSSNYRFIIYYVDPDVSFFELPPVNSQKKISLSKYSNFNNVNGKLEDTCVVWDGMSVMRNFDFYVKDNLVRAQLSYFPSKWNDYELFAKTGYPPADDFFEACQEIFESIQEQKLLSDQFAVLDNIINSFTIE